LQHPASSENIHRALLPNKTEPQAERKGTDILDAPRLKNSECYVQGEAHTNGLENFWSVFKRALKGTYIAVAPFHLFRYVEEQSFRFNNRLKSDFGRFFQALRQVVGKRLTYRRLAGIGDAGFMGIQ